MSNLTSMTETFYFYFTFSFMLSVFSSVIIFVCTSFHTFFIIKSILKFSVQFVTNNIFILIPKVNKNGNRILFLHFAFNEHFSHYPYTVLPLNPYFSILTVELSNFEENGGFFCVIKLQFLGLIRAIHAGRGYVFIIQPVFFFVPRSTLFLPLPFRST